MTTTSITPRPVSYRRLLGSAVSAAAGAALVNALLYPLGRLLGAFPSSMLVQGRPFSVIPVVSVTVTSILVAALVFALLARFVKNPKRVFWFVAAAVFMLMFFMPFSIPAAPTWTIVILELMHVVTAAGAVWAVRRS